MNMFRAKSKFRVFRPALWRSTSARTLATLTLSAGVYLPAFSYGNEDFFSEIEVDTQTQTSSRFSFLGYVQQDAHYGISSPDANLGFARTESGLSAAKTSVFSQVKIDGSDTDSHWMFSAKAETNWVQWQEDKLDITPNHSRIFLKDAYFDTRFENGAWLRVGHQIIAWGESEGLPIADVLAPQDSRAPGQAELRDVREQIPAAKLNLPVANLNLELVTTYKAGSNRLASADEPFYPYQQLDNNGLTVQHLGPANEWEFAAKLAYQFNGGDIAIIAADSNTNDYTTIDTNDNTVEFQQGRVAALAMLANKTFGNWLLKGEAGAFWNQPIQSPTPFKTNQYRFMAGAEYSGWTNWRMSVELNGAVNEESLADSNQDIGYVLRISQNAYNERLKNQLWLLNITGDLGSALRWDSTYELSDSWQIGAGVILYSATNETSPYYIFKNNDEVLFSIKYSFY